MTTPMRTCVGCRTSRAQAKLLRFRRRSDGVVVSSGRFDSGRSAYLCPTRMCFDRAVSRRGFVRALGRRAAVRVEPEPLWASLEASLSLLAARPRAVTPACGAGRGG